MCETCVHKVGFGQKAASVAAQLSLVKVDEAPQDAAFSHGLKTLVDLGQVDLL